MLTREQLRQTEQWQALNKIWKTMDARQRESIMAEFQLLSSFIQNTLEPPRDYAAEDAAYKDELSSGGALFAGELERSGLHLYDGFLKIIAKSTFESQEKLMVFFDFKYQRRYEWVNESRDEVLEILDLAWRRSVERGFVPGEGMKSNSRTAGIRNSE